ncbi:paraquat-inducible protein A [Roseivivax sediminis]|uniref:Paraquat-inducible protein A n=1 Tax=Roseivivax sediminis TaxID=936889 RepID=A0A1I1YGH5_9RHOB|nr:paraquat-inducible protein A [Roseivivax sediminis]SFE18489.1 Paraquat-inducible protein A [Roseivivax sediminis]
MSRRLRLAILAVLVLLYPVAWTAPLLRAGLLPLFGLAEISVLSGLATLWDTDPALALVVALFAIVAPYLKLAGLLIDVIRPLGPRAHMALLALGRLAMADIFLIALYVAVAKGIGVGRVETAWGLYLFTLCVLTSLAVEWNRER